MTAAQLLHYITTAYTTAFGGQRGLVFVAAVALYVRKICSGASKFPITIPTQWLPVVSAGAGLVYGSAEALQQGLATQQVLLAGFATAAAGGFFDLFATALYDHGSLPKWVQALLMLIDAGGQASGGGALPTPPADRRASWPKGPFTHETARPEDSTARKRPRSLRGWLPVGLAVLCCGLLLVIVGVLGTTLEAGCLPAAAVPAVVAAAECTTNELEREGGLADPWASASKCAVDDVVAAGALFVSLLADEKWTAAHPVAAARIRAAIDGGSLDASPDVASDAPTCVGSAPCFAGDPGYIPSPGVYYFPPPPDAAFP